MIPRKAKRDLSEPEIVRALEGVGMTVYRLDQPVDLLCGYRGRNYLVECKTDQKRGGKNKKTELQAKFLEEWRGQAVILYDAQSAIDWAVQVLSEKAA